MSSRLRGPPEPHDKKGPDPPDARTFIAFAVMMVVISTVIIGVGGALHGFPTFSEPAEPEGGDAGDDAEDETDEAEGEGDNEDGTESDGANGNQIDIETEQQNDVGFGDDG